MGGMVLRVLALLAALTAAAGVLDVATGDGRGVPAAAGVPEAAPPRPERAAAAAPVPAEAAPPRPERAAAAAPVPPPAPDTALPAEPAALAERMTATDRALRAAVGAWRTDGDPARGAPPGDVTLHALYLQRAERRLARAPRLAAATATHLPPRLAHQTRDVTRALRALRRLSAGWPRHRVRTGPPEPLGRLLRHYRAAQRRFGVGWPRLAAVNLVESAFGRLRNESVSGARGPMQFMPATWRAYGLGGDVQDPRDAILGAANLLRHNGAPGDYDRALHAYNPSPLYVEAVQRYARLIARDRDAVYVLYSRQVFVRERRVTGPGLG
jgi:membrane-bound lytic murein transglycosylase B